MAHEPAEYLAIAYWGHILGSYPYYVKAQQAAAAHEDAPLEAVCKQHGTETWVTIDGCADKSHRSAFDAFKASRKGV